MHRKHKKSLFVGNDQILIYLFSVSYVPFVAKPFLTPRSSLRTPNCLHFLCPNATSTTPTMMIAIAATPITVILSPANTTPRVTAITGFT